ncbi:MAG: pyridoxal-phosphate dependent enzyme [Bacteroidales bacterium]|nr:pyridoxal-phosphate dependent enzyme [Bacteroidales bacterium]
MNKKFHFKCRTCGHRINGFKEWFSHGQKCPKCGDNKINTVYNTDKKKLLELISKDAKPESLWHYFDFLPLENKENIVTEGEGVAPIERWDFFEDYAKRKYNLNLEVYINRNDKSFATGTFKDKGGAVAASVLKEQGIKEYVVVSTGNTASAFAHYLAKAGVSCSVFVPEDSLPDSEAHIGTYGQKLFRVKGDYAYAKKVAAEYAKKHGLLITGGNLDPLRLEAKKTQVFEMMRVTGKTPDVYIQALSGGTGPFAVEKAYNDFEELNIFGKLPRFLLSQGHLCAPMAAAWKDAKEKKYPEGWEKDYPVYENPKTLIPTIATGNPGMYPLMGPLVKKSGGEIFPVNEELAVPLARLVGFERVIKIGPASAAGVLGFFEALKRGLIKDGESVFINMGESANRATDFLKEVSYTTENIKTSDDAKRFNRDDYKKQVWEPFETY